MCFDLDSRPPITPIAGGALDATRLTLTGADGSTFSAFRTRAATPTGAGMLVLPDVRGLHAYYEELALRLAEAGIDSLAIDYFGRTAGLAPRAGDFEYRPHVEATTWPNLADDIRIAIDELRRDGRVRAIFAVGFCFGGRLALVAPTLPLWFAGAIGFYGWPTGPSRNGTPAPVEVAGSLAAPVLAIFAGADQGIPPETVRTCEEALAAARTATGIEHEVVTYPDAPHSFFDRKAADFVDASADAWARILAFVRANAPPA